MHPNILDPEALIRFDRVALRYGVRPSTLFIELLEDDPIYQIIDEDNDPEQLLPLRNTTRSARWRFEFDEACAMAGKLEQKRIDAAYIESLEKGDTPKGITETRPDFTEVVRPVEQSEILERIEQQRELRKQLAADQSVDTSEIEKLPGINVEYGKSGPIVQGTIPVVGKARTGGPRPFIPTDPDAIDYLKRPKS